MIARLKYIGFVFLAFTLVTGFSSCGNKKRKKVTKTRTEGYKGEAKLNPYLAAQRFLQEASGSDVSVRSGFVKYEPRLAMVVSPASTLDSKVVTDKMLRWVRDGGIYVCLMQRGDKRYVDLGEKCEHTPKFWLSMESEGLSYLLEKFDIELVDNDVALALKGEDYSGKPDHPVVLGKELPAAKMVNITMGDESYSMKLGGTKLMKYGRTLKTADYLSNYNTDYFDGSINDKTHRFLGLKHGAGRIYFITDGRAFRNPYLAMKDHASVLERMAERTYGDIVFSFAKRRGFWALMANYAWPALLGIFVLLVLWLWKNMPRFGPLLEVGDGNTKDYAQSVRNTGHFLWQYNRKEALLNPLRDEIYKRSGLMNREGEIGEKFVEHLSESSGVPEDQVLEAFSRNESIDPTTMVRMTKNLQTILNAL